MIETAKKRRIHHNKSIEEAKKRAKEKNIKPTKVNNIISQNANSLFSNSWKKGSKGNGDMIKRAKESRRKLEKLAQRGVD